jgi:hypothetical protein
MVREAIGNAVNHNVMTPQVKAQPPQLAINNVKINLVIESVNHHNSPSRDNPKRNPM